MRKLFALLFVAAAFTFVACEKKAETSNADSTASADTAAADVAAPATVDTSAAAADTAAAKADTSAHAPAAH